MSLDGLLLWLSARREGAWTQFRGAVEELHVQQEASAPDEEEDERERTAGSSDLPIYQQVRFTLQRLAHVEFSRRGSEIRWRVVPPALAFLPSAPEQGLLCGARSPALLERLVRLADIEVIQSEAEGMPRRILLRGPSQDIVVARAGALGVLIQRAAPMAMLSAIPDVRNPWNWHLSPMPGTPGWNVHRFSGARLQWEEVQQRDAARADTGLFRFVMKHQRFYYLRRRGESYRVPVQVGKYVVIGKRHGLIAYDDGRHTLSVPAICRPPLLIERALVICSGFLPRFDRSSGCVEYGDVPPSAARLAAQLLSQDIR